MGFRSSAWMPYPCGVMNIQCSRPLKSLLVLLAVTTLGGLTACGGGEVAPGERQRAPAFELPSLDGDSVSLQGLSGQVVLIDFWATWCVPCHKQQEIMEPLYPEFKDRGVEFLSIDVEESEDAVRAFVEQHPFPNPVLLDENGEVQADFDVFGLPTLVLVDQQGRIAFQRTSVTDEATLRRLIEQEL